MDKKFDAYKTIGEVSKELNIPTHIIRFWETKFERLKSEKEKIIIVTIVRKILYLFYLLKNLYPRKDIQLKVFKKAS